ncbi:hypothetical protein GWK47_027209 [Chionoecetes opilio]|uniref:Uncharacterized protein n=1 Tax=Chionoecetes opilio TaxID=41210 RepID=A0A8J8WLQ2_CHIOP|nr:hypothetical protein GWK47_027209 [Chionoecetes opilio]
MEPTRGKNILGLIISKKLRLPPSYNIAKTVMSDHNLIHARANIRNIPTRNTTMSGRIDSFHALNFYGRNIDWDKVRKELDAIKRENIFSGKEAHEMYEVLSRKCLQICKEHIPLRRWAGRKHQIPRDRRILMKKRANLQRKLKKVTYAVWQKTQYNVSYTYWKMHLLNHTYGKENKKKKTCRGKYKSQLQIFLLLRQEEIDQHKSVGPLLKENGELEDGHRKRQKCFQMSI